MLGMLIESKAKRQRRAGGAVLSVAAHLAIVGVVAATAVHGTTPTKEPVKATFIHFVPPVARTPLVRTPPASASAAPSRAVIADLLPRISVPIIVPKSLPPIDASNGFSLDSITAPLMLGGGSGVSRGLTFGDDQPAGGGAWKGNELLMHILTPARPRYPESLRQAGVDGRVVVRFTVDTTGCVDMATVQIVTSTHDLFTRAVREALERFRFKPAEVQGRRVAALAEMPFEFQISR
jgi:periplasmic protein TonB